MFVCLFVCLVFFFLLLIHSTLMTRTPSGLRYLLLDYVVSFFFLSVLDIGNGVTLGSLVLDLSGRGLYLRLMNKKVKRFNKLVAKTGD